LRARRRERVRQVGTKKQTVEVIRRPIGLLFLPLSPLSPLSQLLTPLVFLIAKRVSPFENCLSAAAGFGRAM